MHLPLLSRAERASDIAAIVGFVFGVGITSLLWIGAMALLAGAR